MNAEELRERALGELDVDPEAAVETAREAVEQDASDESFYVLGLALSEAGLLGEALEAFHEALALNDSHVDAWTALGRCLFDHWDFREARVTLMTALRMDPMQPEALYYRACLRERRGDQEGAARDYAAATHLDPVHFPLPSAISEADIRELWENMELPETLWALRKQVALQVVEVPEQELAVHYEPTPRPLDILCHLWCTPIGARKAKKAWSHFPPLLQIYRCNLRRLTPPRLKEELREAVIHQLESYLESN